MLLGLHRPPCPWSHWVTLGTATDLTCSYSRLALPLASQAQAPFTRLLSGLSFPTQTGCAGPE